MLYIAVIMESLLILFSFSLDLALFFLMALIFKGIRRMQAEDLIVVVAFDLCLVFLIILSTLFGVTLAKDVFRNICLLR
jgi:hypothetical protein